MLTVAQAEQQLKPIFRQFRPAALVEEVKTRYGFTHKTQAEEVIKVLRFLKKEIIDDAKHMFYHELSLCVAAPDEPLNYISDKLNNGYRRSVFRNNRQSSLLKREIETGIKEIISYWDDKYKNMELQDAIIQAIQDKVDREARMAQEREDQARREEAERLRQEADERRQEEARARIDAGLPPIQVNMDGVVAGAMANGRLGSATESITKVQRNYCLHNNAVAVFDWVNGKCEKYYISKEILQKLFFRKANEENEEHECCICLESVAHHHCGNHRSCPGYYCDQCYHKMAEMETGGSCAMCRQPLQPCILGAKNSCTPESKKINTPGAPNRQLPLLRPNRNENDDDAVPARRLAMIARSRSGSRQGSRAGSRSSSANSRPLTPNAAAAAF